MNIALEAYETLAIGPLLGNLESVGICATLHPNMCHCLDDLAARVVLHR